MRPLLSSLLACACLVACTASDKASPLGPPDSATDGATDSGWEAPVLGEALTEFSVARDPDRPLVVWITLAAEVAGTATLQASSEGAPTRDMPTFAIGPSPVTVPFLGLRADRDYALDLQVSLDDGRRTSGSAEVRTGSLPADLPPIDVRALLPDRIQPGFVLVPLSKWIGGPIADWGYVLGFDEEGEVCWLISTQISSTFDVQADGTLLLTELVDNAVAVDPLGRVVHRLPVREHGMDTVHHDYLAFQNPDDSAETRLLLLSSEMRRIDGYDDGAGGTRSHNVVADVLVETDWSGAIHREVHLFDLLDPLRTLPDFDLPFWQIDPYGPGPDPKDLSHGNALLRLDEGRTWLVSLRNQDWILQIDRDSGALLNRLGHEGDFTLTSGRWFSAQHSPKLRQDGHLLLYDNGANRPGESLPNTRIVEFAVDWEARTLTQIWEWRGISPYYVPAAGDVDVLANGNLLVTDGGVVDAVRTIDGKLNVHLTPRFVELSGEPGAFEVAMEVVVGNWGDFDSPGYIAYRGEKVSSLYGSGGVAAVSR